MCIKALSASDCISCLLILFSGLARTIYWHKYYWAMYDVFIHLGIGGITSGWGNLIIVCAALDRLIYIKNVLPKGPPTFCYKGVARKMISLSFFISLLMNIPYFFIYRTDETGYIQTTSFFQSLYYQVHNWVRFIVTGLFPAIFLTIANGIMIVAIRKWSRCAFFIKAVSKDKSRLQVRIKKKKIPICFFIELVNYFFVILGPKETNNYISCCCILLYYWRNSNLFCF